MVKNLPASAGVIGDSSSIPGSGRSPGVGNGNPLQYSCLENPVDRGAWRATVQGVTKSQTQLSEWAHTRIHAFVFKAPYFTSPSPCLWAYLPVPPFYEDTCNSIIRPIRIIQAPLRHLRALYSILSAESLLHVHRAPGRARRHLGDIIQPAAVLWVHQGRKPCWS